MPKSNRIAKIDSVPFGTRPKVLLLGNGINLSFDGVKNTDELLRNLYEKNYSDEVRNGKEFDKLAFPMKVIVATKDQVNTYMKDLADHFKATLISNDQKEFLSEILSNNWQAVLTTNYSLEIEQTIIPNFSVGRIPQYYRYTNKGQINKDKYNLYRCIQCSDTNTTFWHIHGIALKKDSMVMGHYYYGELLSHIVKQSANAIRAYKAAESQKTPFFPKSWIDYFLIGDVYCVGFKLDLSEMDIWWLLENKKLHFPESHFYFFEPDNSEPSKEMMLKSYGVLCPKNIIKEGDDYVGYYTKVCAAYGS